MELGPLTCRVAVTGLAWCLRVPSVIVLLTVLTVWPSCVVTAALTVPTVACAPIELPVKRALLRVSATVAGWERWRGVCMRDGLCGGREALLSGAGVTKMGVLSSSYQPPRTQTFQGFLQ